MTRVVKLQAHMAGTPSVDHPKPERLLHGNPERHTWNLVDESLPQGHVDCGIWRCEPGHWRIAFGPTQRELFTVLQGRCRIHDAQGGYEEAGPGEALYLPPGFEGSFEVIEAVTKSYMICT